MRLCLGLFCRYMAFAIILKGNTSHIIRGQIWSKLAMCQVTSQNLARCQVTCWELGMVPSHMLGTWHGAKSCDLHWQLAR